MCVRVRVDLFSCVCLAGGDRSVLRDAPGEMQAARIEDSGAGRPSHLCQPAVRHAGEDLQPYATWSP